MSTLRTWLVVMAAACGTPRTAPVGPEPAAPLDGVSPQRVLRLAARCPTARGEATPVAWWRDGRGEWRVRLHWPEAALDTHPDDVAPLPPGSVRVDPVAGTCDGHAVEVAPEPGDVPLEAILLRAERCSGVAIDRADVRITGKVAGGQIGVDPEPTVFDSLFVTIDAATGACTVDTGGFGPLAVTRGPGPRGFAPWRGL